ncbi:hypothetical protein [Rufibacter latericius]|uniref:HEAT repeat domain-containing protein n=1 Tax=Rufibacter latericius TaxID=2487040 RepID=A0A3M9MD80_9BACT|nr:hypothetical protein [Rufibacter latericius]RNI22548.1 hypothetical protein EFB08_20840 [Rufibacter latericius]
MTTAEFQALLTEGKPKSKGHADEAALFILENGEDLLAALWPCLFDLNPGVRSRAAHVVEAVAKKQPSWFKPYQNEILENLALPELDPAFYFFIPSLLGLLHWSDEEVPTVVDRLQYWLQYLDHQFVKVFCLQSLTDLARQQPWLKQEVEELMHHHMAKGGKAINARGRMLLKILAKL